MVYCGSPIGSHGLDRSVSVLMTLSDLERRHVRGPSFQAEVRSYRLTLNQPIQRGNTRGWTYFRGQRRPPSQGDGATALQDFWKIPLPRVWVNTTSALSALTALSAPSASN